MLNKTGIREVMSYGCGSINCFKHLRYIQKSDDILSKMQWHGLIRKNS